MPREYARLVSKTRDTCPAAGEMAHIETIGRLVRYPVAVPNRGSVSMRGHHPAVPARRAEKPRPARRLRADAFVIEPNAALLARIPSPESRKTLAVSEIRAAFDSGGGVFDRT